jgi:hypothetical protein
LADRQQNENERRQQRSREDVFHVCSFPWDVSSIGKEQQCVCHRSIDRTRSAVFSVSSR